jgi:outer membrane receptor protein involved in Fe transport
VTLAVLNGETFYHHETIHGDRYRGLFDRAIYAPELTSGDLADVGLLIVPDWLHPDLLEAPRPRSARQVASPGRQAGRTPRVTAAPQPAPATSTNTTSGRAAEIVGPLGGQYPKPESLHQATQSITVVDRKEIELTDPTSTLDILAGVPGVSIARSGGIGGQIYLRGFSSNNMRSPLYIDGDRLHGRNTLQYQYFAPEEIERVEVIRGPASVLYGSDALTGSST